YFSSAAPRRSRGVVWPSISPGGSAQPRCVREKHFPAAPCAVWGTRTWLPISDHELVWPALPLFSSLGASSCARKARGFLQQLFQLLQRGVVDVIFFSRGFGHARLIHFLFDGSEYPLLALFFWLVPTHSCPMSRTQSYQS